MENEQKSKPELMIEIIELQKQISKYNYQIECLLETIKILQNKNS